jgi:hypothetical protein
MARAKIHLPPDVLAYFRHEGLRGGAMGGRKAAANMTAAERKERAKKGGLRAAALMTAAARSARAKKAGRAAAAARRAKKAARRPD